MNALAATDQPVYSSFGDDPDMSDLVDLFVDEMPERIANLLRQVDQADWTAVCRTAHQMKGSAGSYGFAPLTASAGRLEMGLKASEPEEQIRQKVEDLVALCRRASKGPAPR